jgi:MFS family permease
MKTLPTTVWRRRPTGASLQSGASDLTWNPAEDSAMLGIFMRGLIPSFAISSHLHAYLTISALLSLSTWVLLLLPNFLEERGWSSQEIGWAIGSFFLVNLLCQVLSGQISNRLGSVRTALSGAGLGCLGGFLYLAALWHPVMIFPSRVLHGAGTAMVFTGALMQLLRSVPLDLRGRVMGYYGLPGFVMLGIGPALSEWFIYHWGFEGIFVSIPIMFLAVTWILLRLARPWTPIEVRRQSFTEALSASIPRLKAILIFSMFFGLCFSAWNSFIAPAVRAVGNGAVSSFGMGYGLGAVATRLGISHRLDTGQRRLAAISTLFLYSTSMALIPHSTAVWQLALLGLACGTVHGTYYPALSSIAAERFHPVHEGQAMGLYIAASGLGMFLGPPLWGALADFGGYRLVFAAAGLSLAFNTVFFLISEYRRKPSARGQSQESTVVSGIDD